MVDELLLITGNDIPFVPAEITIHQPTIQEIAYIGEDAFLNGANFLNFSKDKLTLDEGAAKQIEQLDDFTLLMSLLHNRKDPASQLQRVNIEMVLTLMFPEGKVLLMPNMIAIVIDGVNHIINQENFDEFREIVAKMYSLGGEAEGEREYNPANPAAKAIVDKIKRGRQKVKEIKSQNSEGQSESILSRYISILAVGEQKDMNLFKNYTVFQLFDEFNRFSLKQQFDQNLSFRLAGAQDLQQPEDWMKNLYSFD